MQEQDKIAFKKMMIAMSNLYNKPALEKDVLRVWWSLLEDYETEIVFTSFSKFTKMNEKFPTPADIVKLCKAHKIEFTQLPAPKLSKEQNKEYADNIMNHIAQNVVTKPRDMKAWARNIIANPAKYPAISLKFAKDAINAH